MNDTNSNILIPESIEGLESLKRRIYLGALPFGIVAILVGWVFKNYAGELTLVERVIFPTLLFSCLGLELALWSTNRALVLVEISLFSMSAIGILSRFYEILFLLDTPLSSIHVSALSDLFYWFPLVYVLAFLTFESQRGHLIGSLLFFIVALIIGLIFGLQYWLTGHEPEILYLLSRFYLANIIYIVLLRMSTSINERYIQGRTLAKTMELLALTDHLTGIANRRQLEKAITQEIAQVQRYGQVFSGIMIDLDHFKQVNYTYGHDIGDYVLRETVMTFKLLLRPSDLIGRWGGEEFLILARQTDAANACVLAERLRQAITAHKFKHIGRLTASFGVAEYLATETMDPWLKRIDKALYEAKKQGRNRVNIAENG